MTLRRAGAEDAREVGELELRAWWWTYRDVVAHEKLTEHDPDVRESAWSAMLDGGREVWVRLVDDRIVGVVALEPERVGDVLVDPTAQGAGVGSELLAFAEERLAEQGTTRAELWCLQANELARAFFNDRGWEATGEEQPHDWGAEARYVKDLAAASS